MGKAELKEFITNHVKVNIDKHLRYFIRDRELKKYLVEKTGITNQEADVIIKVLVKFVNQYNIDIEPTPIESGGIFDIIINGMVNGLMKDKKLTLPNFGSFRVKESKARKARNPRTGESVQVPDRNVVRFKIAGKLKRLIAG